MLKKNQYVPLHLLFISSLRASVIIILLISMVLGGCRKSGQQPLRAWMNDSNKIKVLSTVKQIGDLAADIGGERIDSWILIRGSLDPHHYELVKGDGEKLEHADLIFYNGLGLEHGASLSSWLNSSKKATALGDYILQRYPDCILTKDDTIDPHIWMDVSIWAKTADIILEQLMLKDPDGAFYYKERARSLRERMEKTHQEILHMVHRIPASRRYFVTSHDAFQYFTRSYLADKGEIDWTKRFAAPEGLAPDGQLSPVDIQRMIDYIKQNRIAIVFTESNVNRDSLEKIADASRELGCRVQICEEPLFADAIDGDLHYLDMMLHNAKIISKHMESHERD